MIKDTKTMDIRGEKRCAFCAGVVEEYVEYDEYTPYRSSFCTCEMAQEHAKTREAMYKIQEKVKRMEQKTLSKKDIEKIELEILKKKYDR